MRSAGLCHPDDHTGDQEDNDDAGDDGDDDDVWVLGLHSMKKTVPESSILRSGGLCRPDQYADNHGGVAEDDDDQGGVGEDDDDAQHKDCAHSLVTTFLCWASFSACFSSSSSRIVFGGSASGSLGW